MVIIVSNCLGFGRLSGCSSMNFSFSDQARWLCLFTQPHRERLASASLREAGFDVYLPVVKKLVLRHGARSPVRVPLFPRYIFIGGQGEPVSYLPACRAKGVTSFAARTLEQSWVCGSVVQALKDNHDDEGLVSFDPKRIKAGQSVRLLAGPFAGFEGLFAEPDDRKRSVILLSLLGKTHRMSIPNRILEVAA